MSIFQPATAYSNSIVRPTCPKCGSPQMMQLARIEPTDKPGHDERTFECIKCNCSVSEVVKFG